MKARFVMAIVLCVVLALAVSAASRTFYVQESDFVKINPEGIDLDHDKITYTYSAPLDEQGEWQTGFDDAGEYEISITASDGQDESVEKVNLIVTNKNQPPYLAEKTILVKETQTIDLKSLVKDPDEDPLQFTFSEPFDKSGKWQPTYDDEGNYLVEFIVSDGEFSIKARVGVEVLPTNEPPVIKEVFSNDSELSISEDSVLKFFVSAKDNDGDGLTYIWKLNEKIISNEKEGEINFDFSSSGKYLLDLVVNDGLSNTRQSWEVVVSNKNRKPVLDLEDVVVKEGETVVLVVPATDEDGDTLTYTFDEKLDSEGKWKTSFEDAGTYSFRVTATDGDLEDSTKVNVIVEDVDRAPLLVLPPQLEVNEGEELKWNVNVNDPDGDEVSIVVEGAPEGALFFPSKNSFVWEPSFDFISRREGFVSNILNSLRLEKHLLKKRVNTLNVKACGKELCTSGSVDLITYNVNRGPSFDNLATIYVNETDELKLDTKAVDPDGDIVKYFFAEPLTRRGGTWKTTYDDEGNYTFYVSATDGEIEKTVPVNVIVEKKNREPSVIVSTEKVLVNEGEEFTVFVDATDPDNDELDITLDFLPFGAEFRDGAFVWTPNFDNIQNKTDSLKNTLVKDSDYLNRRFNSEKKVYWITFTADDGEVTTKHPVKITVKNKNRQPELVDVIPEKVVARINEPVVFQVLAGDDDNDALEYKWSFGLRDTAVGGTNAIERTFVSAGDKKVQVAISDGRDTIVKEWDVTVVNENYIIPAQPMNFGKVKVYVVDI